MRFSGVPLFNHHKRQKESPGWREEFDRRVARGDGVDREMGRGFGRFRGNTDRVRDDAGNKFTRDGQGCCGCGRWENDHHGPPVASGGKSQAVKRSRWWWEAGR